MEGSSLREAWWRESLKTRVCGVRDGTKDVRRINTNKREIFLEIVAVITDCIPRLRTFYN